MHTYVAHKRLRLPTASGLALTATLLSVGCLRVSPDPLDIDVTQHGLEFSGSDTSSGASASSLKTSYTLDLHSLAVDSNVLKYGQVSALQVTLTATSGVTNLRFLSSVIVTNTSAMTGQSGEILHYNQSSSSSAGRSVTAPCTNPVDLSAALAAGGAEVGVEVFGDLPTIDWTADLTISVRVTPGNAPSVGKTQQTSTITVTGTVADANGPVAGATLSAGGASTATQKDGTYTITIASPGARVAIKVVAPNHGPTTAIILPKTSVYHYRHDIEMVASKSATIDPAAGGEIVVSSQGAPVKISVPAGAVQGSDRVTITAAGYTADNGPGALDTPDAPGQNKLQTQGMVYFAVSDAYGNPVRFAPGAGVKINVQNTSVPNIPEADTMKEWKLNEQGQWDTSTPTTTTAQGANLTAQEQGYWNADRAYRTACVIGHAKAPAMSCGGATARANGLDGISTMDMTEGDGTFCVEGPQGVSTNITIGSTHTSVTMPRAPGNCTTSRSACADVGTIALRNSDCPQGCPAGQTDSPTGCHSGNTSNTCDVPLGSCVGSFSASRIRSGCCASTLCASSSLGSCADSCENVWYEVGNTIYGPCSAADTTCLMNAAEAATQACE